MKHETTIRKQETLRHRLPHELDTGGKVDERERKKHKKEDVRAQERDTGCAGETWNKHDRQG